MRIHMREKHVLETAHFFTSSPHETTAGRTLLSQFLALYSFYTWLSTFRNERHHIFLNFYSKITPLCSSYQSKTITIALR